jgi:hypothetical protein
MARCQRQVRASNIARSQTLPSQFAPVRTLYRGCCCRSDLRRCEVSSHGEYVEPDLEIVLGLIAPRGSKIFRAVEVIIILVEVTRVTADCLIPGGNVTGREQVPGVLGNHVAQLTPRLNERGIDPRLRTRMS